MEKTKEQLEQKIRELQDENDRLWAIIGYVKKIERLLRDERKENENTIITSQKSRQCRICNQLRAKGLHK